MKNKLLKIEYRDDYLLVFKIDLYKYDKESKLYKDLDNLITHLNIEGYGVELKDINKFIYLKDIDAYYIEPSGIRRVWIEEEQDKPTQPNSKKKILLESKE